MRSARAPELAAAQRVVRRRRAGHTPGLQNHTAPSRTDASEHGGGAGKLSISSSALYQIRSCLNKGKPKVPRWILWTRLSENSWCAKLVEARTHTHRKGLQPASGVRKSNQATRELSLIPLTNIRQGGNSPRDSPPEPRGFDKGRESEARTMIFAHLPFAEVRRRRLGVGAVHREASARAVVARRGV